MMALDDRLEGGRMSHDPRARTPEPTSCRAVGGGVRSIAVDNVTGGVAPHDVVVLALIIVKRVAPDDVVEIVHERIAPDRVERPRWTLIVHKILTAQRVITPEQALGPGLRLAVDGG